MRLTAHITDWYKVKTLLATFPYFLRNYSRYLFHSYKRFGKRNEGKVPKYRNFVHKMEYGIGFFAEQKAPQIRFAEECSPNQVEPRCKMYVYFLSYHAPMY
jgi:hypothetical protein